LLPSLPWRWLPRRPAPRRTIILLMAVGTRMIAAAIADLSSF
jgi:hypothetical protein